MSDIGKEVTAESGPVDAWAGLMPRFAALSESHLRQMSPLALAYVGDAVYELYVRTQVASKDFAQVDRLHKQSVAFVRAEAQAAALRVLEPYLSSQELEVVRKGRNAKGRQPQGTSLADYRKSTGFEALIGYLYLAAEYRRLEELLGRSLDAVQQNHNPTPGGV